MIKKPTKITNSTTIPTKKPKQINNPIPSKSIVKSNIETPKKPAIKNLPNQIPALNLKVSSTNKTVDIHKSSINPQAKSQVDNSLSSNSTTVAKIETLDIKPNPLPINLEIEKSSEKDSDVLSVTTQASINQQCDNDFEEKQVILPNDSKIVMISKESFQPLKIEEQINNSNLEVVEKPLSSCKYENAQREIAEMGKKCNQVTIILFNFH